VFHHDDPFDEKTRSLTLIPLHAHPDEEIVASTSISLHAHPDEKSVASTLVPLNARLNKVRDEKLERTLSSAVTSLF
jgi:hypothetical protein